MKGCYLADGPRGHRNGPTGPFCLVFEQCDSLHWGMTHPMNDVPAHDATVTRRRTSPEAKWLINEVAALRGCLATVLKKRAALAAEESKLRQRIAALELVMAPLPVPVGALPPARVNAQTRYGTRGSLSAALLAVLRNAGPQGLSTIALRQAIAEHFQVPMELNSEREHLRMLVARRLRHLAVRGLVEKVPFSAPSKTNVLNNWRACRSVRAPRSPSSMSSSCGS